MGRRRAGDPEALARSDARMKVIKAKLRAEIDGRGLGPDFERTVSAIPFGIRTSTSIYMDAQVLAALKFISERKGMSLQSLMREALDDVIKKHAKPGASRGTKRQRVDGEDRVSGGSGAERAEQA